MHNRTALSKFCNSRIHRANRCPDRWILGFQLETQSHFQQNFPIGWHILCTVFILTAFIEGWNIINHIAGNRYVLFNGLPAVSVFIHGCICDLHFRNISYCCETLCIWVLLLPVLYNWINTAGIFNAVVITQYRTYFPGCRSDISGVYS